MALMFSPEPADGTALSANAEALLERHGARLLALARASIASRLGDGATMAFAMQDMPSELKAPGAVFVTLTEQGRLRGCVGTPAAWRPLVEDVIDNAAAAALEDFRFAPLAAEALGRIAIALSLLSPPSPLFAGSEAELIATLVPGRDGLILSEGGRKALFLPQVWEQLPEPRDFLGQLRRKAGLGERHWSSTLAFQRFTTASVAEPGAGH